MLDFLQELGIDEMNSGASAGSFFETRGDLLSSDSPCDGQNIAKIMSTHCQNHQKFHHKHSHSFYQELPIQHLDFPLKMIVQP